MLLRYCQIEVEVQVLLLDFTDLQGEGASYYCGVEVGILVSTDTTVGVDLLPLYNGESIDSSLGVF